MTITDAQRSGTIQRVPFRQHVQSLQWEQGQHILICAPTGAGKTTFVRPLLEKRSHVVNLVTKIHDDAFRKEYKGWTIIREWPPSRFDSHVLLWPKPGKTLTETLQRQRAVIRHALNEIGRGRGWCVTVDEAHYTTDPHYLGLGKEVAILHHQGRSSGISVVNLSQRPAWIPKIIYSSVSHAYIAKTKDRNDLKRLSDLSGVDGDELARDVRSMPSKYDYAYVDTQTDGTSAVMLNSRR